MLLRILLFSGLILHKLVWEAVKSRGDRPSLPAPGRAQSSGKKVVKYLKVVFLLFLLVQTLVLDVFPISNSPAVIIAVGVALYGVGLGMAILARVQLGRNWANVEDAQALPGQALVTNGIYRYVRHPIYAGDALLLIGLELALNSWLVVLMCVPVLIFVKQALSEEALLAQAFPGYAAYTKQSKRFIPFVV